MIYLKLWVLCALLHLTTTQVQKLDGELREQNTDSNEEVVQYFYVLFPKKEPRPYIPAVLVPFMAPSPHPKALAFFLPAPLADWAEEHNPFDAPQAMPPFDTSIYPSVPMRELPAIPREIAHKIQAQIDASMSSGSNTMPKLQHLNGRGGQEVDRESLRKVDSSTFNGKELAKASKITNDEEEDKNTTDKHEDKVINQVPPEDDQQSKSGTVDGPIITINPRQFDVRTLKQMEWVDADGNPATAPEFVMAIPPTDNVVEFPGGKVDVSKTSDSLEPMRNNPRKPSNGTIRQPLRTHKSVNIESEGAQTNLQDWHTAEEHGVQQKHAQVQDAGSKEHPTPPSEEAPRNQLEHLGPHQDQEASGPYPMESNRENWMKNDNKKELTGNGSVENDWELRRHRQNEENAESISFNESSKKTAEMERAIDELLGDNGDLQEEESNLALKQSEATTKMSNTGHIRKPVKIKTAIDYNPELFPNLPRPEAYASNSEPTPDYYGRRQEVKAEPTSTKKSHKPSETYVDTTQVGVPITEMEPIEPYSSVNDLQASFGNVAVHPMAAEADPNFIRQLNEQFNNEFPVTNERIDIAVPLTNKRQKVHLAGLSQLPIHKLDEKSSEPDRLDLIPEEEWSFSDGRRTKKVQKTTSRRDEFRAETGEGAAVLRSRKRPDNLKSASFLWGDVSPMPMIMPSEAPVASIEVEPEVTTTATSSVVTAEVETTTREVTNPRMVEQTTSSTPTPHDDLTERDREIATPTERERVAEMAPLLNDRSPDSPWRDINEEYRQGAEVKVEKQHGSVERRTTRPQPNQDVGSDEQAAEFEEAPEDQSEVGKEVSKVSTHIKEAQPFAIKPLHHRKKTHKKRNQKRRKTKKAKNNRTHKTTTTPTPNEDTDSGEAGSRRKPYHHRAYRHRAMAAPRLTMDKDDLLAKNTSDLRKAVVAEVEENTIAPMIFHSSFGLMSTKSKKVNKRISKETRKHRKKTKNTKATKKVSNTGSSRGQQKQYFGDHIMDVKNSTTSSPMTSTRNEYDMLVPEMPEVEQMPTTPKMVRNPSMPMFRRAPFAAPHRLSKNNRLQNRNHHRQLGTTVPQRTHVTVAVESSTNDAVTASTPIPYSEHLGRSEYEDRPEVRGVKDSYKKAAKEFVHYSATSVPNDQVPPRETETDDKRQLFESRSRISPEVVREAGKEPVEVGVTTAAIPVEESATTTIRTTPPMTSTYIPITTRTVELTTTMTKASEPDAQASFPAKESFYNTQQAATATKKLENYHPQRTLPNEVPTSILVEAATPTADVVELKNALDMIAVEPAKEDEYDNSQGYVKIPLEQYNEMILKMQTRAAEEQRAKIEHGILNGTGVETVRELERPTTQAPNTAPPLDDHEQKPQGEAATQQRENNQPQRTSQILEPSTENSQRSFATGNSGGKASSVSAGTVQAVIPLSETVNQEGDYLVRTKVNEYIMKGKAPSNLEQLEKQAALMTEQQLQQQIAQLRQQQQLQNLAQFQALQQSQQGLQPFQQSQPGLQVLQQSQPGLASMQLPMLNPGLLTGPSPYYLNPPMYRYPYRKYLHKN